jgi:hypothetical protein
VVCSECRVGGKSQQKHLMHSDSLLERGQVFTVGEDYKCLMTTKIAITI